MNCIIIHGSNANDEKKLTKGAKQQNERHWFPWLKKELEKKGIKTYTPLMPKNWKPEYKDWKKEFEKLEINENTILIGHSTGGAFLVRWLGENKRKIKKLILVAPAKAYGKDPTDSAVKAIWDLCDFKIDPKIKNLVDEIIIFVSDNERDTIKKAVKIYSKEFNINPIELKGKGHFLIQHMKTEEFPELFEAIVDK